MATKAQKSAQEGIYDLHKKIVSVLKFATRVSKDNTGAYDSVRKELGTAISKLGSAQMWIEKTLEGLGAKIPVAPVKKGKK